MKDHYPVVIIGSGPAGFTAGIYTARAELPPLILEGMQPGGQLTLTSEIENFPGFADGVDGNEMMSILKKQAERFGAECAPKEVTAADLGSRPFHLTLEGGDKVTADAVIIATGASARFLGIESEDRLQGKGVSACAVCDGFFYRGKKVCVVGGGDTAAEEALYLTKFAESVSIIHRRDELRASRIMQERVLNHDKIEVIWDSVVEEVLGENAVTGTRLKNVKTGEITDIEIDGFFLGIGHTPNTKIFQGQIDLDDNGYILVHKGSHTSVPGVFAAGDVADHVYRQAITAAGMGCMAALDAEHFITENS